MPGHAQNPLTHVQDHPSLELPWFSPPHFEHTIELPSVFGFQLTRFMVMELLAGLFMVLVLLPLARHLASRPRAVGLGPNLFEAMLLFIRDQVARPAIGGHAADRFLPYLWTSFFFVLICNLLGMIPGGSSPTASVSVTGVLALATFILVVSSGMKEMGVAGFWLGVVPHIDVPKALYKPLWGLMFVIEIAGLFIRHIVLSIRLFANMFAGHVVLSVILGFILMVKLFSFPFFVVAPASLVGVILLSILELFVAFLQAYIFTFLSALFIGSALHPH